MMMQGAIMNALQISQGVYMRDCTKSWEIASEPPFLPFVLTCQTFVSAMFYNA